MVGDKNEGKSEQVFIIVFISLVLVIVVSTLCVANIILNKVGDKVVYRFWLHDHQAPDFTAAKTWA